MNASVEQGQGYEVGRHLDLSNFYFVSCNAAGMQPWNLPTDQEARTCSRADIFSRARCKLCAACCQQF